MFGFAQLNSVFNSSQPHQHTFRVLVENHPNDPSTIGSAAPGPRGAPNLVLSAPRRRPWRSLCRRQRLTEVNWWDEARVVPTKCSGCANRKWPRYDSVGPLLYIAACILQLLSLGS